jgi:hypothetical protein
MLSINDGPSSKQIHHSVPVTTTYFPAASSPNRSATSSEVVDLPNSPLLLALPMIKLQTGLPIELCQNPCEVSAFVFMPKVDVQH